MLKEWVGYGSGHGERRNPWVVQIVKSSWLLTERLEVRVYPEGPGRKVW